MEDPKKTPPEWQPADFLPGAVEPLKDKDGVIHGLPWIADAYMGAAGRFDIIERAGLAMPDTFDDIVAMCQAVNDQDGVKAFINENHHGWTWIPYLHGFGGDVFVAAARQPDAVARHARGDRGGRVLSPACSRSSRPTACCPTPTTSRSTRSSRAAPTTPPSTRPGWSSSAIPRPARSRARSTTR